MKLFSTTRAGLTLAALIPFTASLTFATPLQGDITFIPCLDNGDDQIDVLLMRVRYTTLPEEPIYPPGGASAYAAMQDEIEQLYESNSYGKAHLNLTSIAPPLQLPQPETFYAQVGGQVWLREHAAAAAEARGYVLGDYDREIILSDPWAWEGFGRSAEGSGNYRTLWISSSAYQTGALWGHELGHSYGWEHANRLDSNDPANPLGSGTLVQYGDVFDTMGDAQNPHHFNPWYKHRAGWLTTGDIQDVTTTGSYTFQALEEDPASVSANAPPNALRIRRTANEDYWVFWRRSEPQVEGGIVLLLGKRNNWPGTTLLDMNPQTPRAFPEWEDVELLETETFTDPGADGFTLEVTDVDVPSKTATVNVTFKDGAGNPKVAQDAIDFLPKIGVVSPAKGVTIQGMEIATTRARVKAFDPDYGSTNGVGIDHVVIALGYYPQDGPLEVLQSTSDSTPPYEHCINFFPLETRKYILQVTAYSLDGGTQQIDYHFLFHKEGGVGPSPAYDCLYQ